MGSTLHVNLCPHKVWREKYGCAECDAEDATTCSVCGHAQGEHSNGHGGCLDDDCECIAFEPTVYSGPKR